MNKGFTLLELISVLLILSFAFLIAGVASAKTLENQKVRLLTTEIHSIKTIASSYAVANPLAEGETKINLLESNAMKEYYKITADPWGNPYEKAEVVFTKTGQKLKIDVYLLVKERGCYKLLEDKNMVLLGTTCEPPPPPPPPPPPTYIAAGLLTDTTPYAYYHYAGVISVYSRTGGFIKTLSLPPGHNNFSMDAYGFVSPSGNFYTLTFKNGTVNPNRFIVKYDKNANYEKTIWSGYEPGWPNTSLEMPWFSQKSVAFAKDGSYYIGFVGRGGPVKSYLKKYRSDDTLAWSKQVGQTYSPEETRNVWIDWEDGSKVYMGYGSSFAYSNGYVKVLNTSDGSANPDIPKKYIAETIQIDPYTNRWFTYKRTSDTTVVDGVICVGNGFIELAKANHPTKAILEAIAFVPTYNNLTQLHPYDEYGFSLMKKDDVTENIPDGEGGYYTSVLSDKYEHVDLYGRKVYKVDYNIPRNRGDLIDIYSGR